MADELPDDVRSDAEVEQEAYAGVAEVVESHLLPGGW